MKSGYLRSCVAFLLFVILCTPFGSAQVGAGAAPSTGDSASIQLIESVITEYVKSVDNLDTSLARKVWSATNEVTFIHPRGTERGLGNILENVYRTMMGRFSQRQLLPDSAEIHVYGDTAWSQFNWTFHATVKDGGAEITTKGRETQIYHKEDGSWHIVHVHYSGMPQNPPGM